MEDLAGKQTLVHGTSLIFEGAGFLIQGASGSGKSTLALRLIYEMGARLIADDYTLLKEKAGLFYLASPPNTKGLIEVKDMGVIRLDMGHVASSAYPLNALIRLESGGSSTIESDLLAHVPCYTLKAQESSLPAKIRLIASLLRQESSLLQEDCLLSA